MKVQETCGEEAASEDICQSKAANEQIRGLLSQHCRGDNNSKDKDVLHQGYRTTQETNGANGFLLQVCQNHVDLQIVTKFVD